MNVPQSNKGGPAWLLLVFSLPRRGASLRVAVWRKLQRHGALPLGNSGYLLPNDPQNFERFEWLAATIRRQQGDASVVEVQSIDNCSSDQLAKRFSDARGRDYREVLKELQGPVDKPGRLAVRMTRLRKRFQEIVSIDFFGSPLREEVERAMRRIQQPTLATSQGSIGRVRRSAYRNRVWVTRSRPGVDRVISAWLIRKFIDPKARFAFSSEDKKPEGAVPYDMYEGGFGHRGEDCTFETLVKVFRVRDRRIAIMAEIVHDADLFDERFSRKEGFGIDEVMKGWARQGLSDQELLARGIQLAEGLYQSLH
jgi:hypothetical protein